MKDQIVAVFSMEQNKVIKTFEASLTKWKEVKAGVWTYLAQVGLQNAIVWKDLDCPTIELPEGLEGAYIWTVD